MKSGVSAGTAYTHPESDVLVRLEFPAIAGEYYVMYMFIQNFHFNKDSNREIFETYEV